MEPQWVLHVARSRFLMPSTSDLSYCPPVPRVAWEERKNSGQSGPRDSLDEHIKLFSFPAQVAVRAGGQSAEKPSSNSIFEPRGLQ